MLDDGGLMDDAVMGLCHGGLNDALMGLCHGPMGCSRWARGMELRRGCDGGGPEADGSHGDAGDVGSRKVWVN